MVEVLAWAPSLLQVAVVVVLGHLVKQPVCQVALAAAAAQKLPVALVARHHQPVRAMRVVR